MAGLLGEVDTNVPTRVLTKNVIKSETRRKVRILSPPLSENSRTARAIEKRRYESPVYEPPALPAEQEASFDIEDDYGLLQGGDDEINLMSDPLPSSLLSPRR